MSAGLVLGLCVLLVAALTAAVTSIRYVSRIWLRHWVELRLRATATAELLVERPHRLLVAGTAASAAVAMVAGGALSSLGTQSTRGAILVVVISVLTLWLVGQLVPRAVARRWPTRLVPALLPLVRAVDALVGPLLGPAPPPRRLTPVPAPAPHRTTPSRDTLHEMLEEGVIEGVGEPEEIAIITGVVRFAEKLVSDVMTPRNAVFAVDAALPPVDIARRIAASGYTRVPVFSGTIDSPTGMIYTFDLLKPGVDTHLPIRPLTFTPADRLANELLGEMMRARRHLVIVRDAAGRTQGLVTLEDLLEELVGDIRDEHDEPSPPPDRIVPGA
jgi:putative hemolysin